VLDLPGNFRLGGLIPVVVRLAGEGDPWVGGNISSSSSSSMIMFDAERKFRAGRVGPPDVRSFEDFFAGVKSPQRLSMMTVSSKDTCVSCLRER
jgi:hypothetical protein